MNDTLRPAASAMPASFAQELLWHLDRATPGQSAYNMPRARRLKGPLDLVALNRALDALAERHEILRTTYSERDGAVWQVIQPPRTEPLVPVDLSQLGPAEQAREAARLVKALSGAPFDLTRDPLLRRGIIRLSPTEHILVLVTHHIASDGWSGTVMQRDLFALYEGFRAERPATLPDLPIQYGDFSAWQRDELQGERLEGLLRFWRAQLDGHLPVLELPTDRLRPAAPGTEGDHRVLELPPKLVAGLRRVGQKHGASLYMVLLAAYQTLLSRLSGQDDILVGSPMAGRDRAETEQLIGFFANTLVYRARFADDPSFDALLARVRDAALGAFEHHEMPLERLLLDRSREGTLSEGSLFRVVFTQLDTSSKHLDLGELSVEPEALSNETVKFDLTLFLADRPDLVRLVLYFRTELFDGDRIERMLGELRTLLEGIASDPSRRVSTLPLLPDAERAELADWNATSVVLGPATTMATMIAEAAARRPGEDAVVSGAVHLTWGDLLIRASQVAHRLRQLGAGPDVPVGLCFDRSADLMVGMVGILLSGGAYVPLLPDTPTARLFRQLADSGARVVVTSSTWTGLFPDAETLCLDGDASKLAGLPGIPPAVDLDPSSLAYILFTSGSTGTPKGVGVTHANLVHYTRAIARVLGMDLRGGGTPWHAATVSTLAADLGHTSVFPTLAAGGTLHVLPSDTCQDASKFQAYMTAHPIDLLKITPGHFQALAGPEFAPVHLPRRWLVTGGEPCSWAIANAVKIRGACRVLNHYGPTETTVGATTFEVGAIDVTRWAPATVPIGAPLANVTAHVLDAKQQPAPVNVPGELWIGGAGVARGYLGRDDLTSERFAVQDGERRYRTGDRVRRLPSGHLEFLGRLDNQVKIRGHRVELGEIESVLSTHPAVRQTVVVLHEDRLTAYLVEHEPVDDAALGIHAAAALPEHMVPAAWVRLARIPLTANGKVDRAALPTPHAGAPAPSGPPQGEIETRLAMLWTEVLKREPIGRSDNFFALGGHSLLAIRLLGRIAKQFGVRLPLRTLFEQPTLAALAVVLVPVHPLEPALTTLWSDILKKEPIPRDASFFALGGHSLLAIRLLGRIAKQFGVRLSLRTLFEHPTIERLAPRLELEIGLASVESLSDEEAERLLAAEQSGEVTP